MREQKPSQLLSRERGARKGRASRPKRAVTRLGAGGQRRSKQRRGSVRAGVAVFAGRAAGAISRRLRLGGGTSIVGLVAQRLYPDIVEHLATQLEHGNVVVTGTNGKTTTSGFIASILQDAGLRVWHNREGSNLMRGVAGMLVMRAHPNGMLRRSGRAISVFELDEAVVPQVVKVAPPRVAVFTNLFRDQLDRYGEVDSVSSRWRQAIKTLPSSTTLVLNADDPTIASLGETFAGPVLYFGIDDPQLDLTAQNTAPERHQVIDTRTCPRCGGEYIYTLRFYSHMGHYRCSHCDLTRPSPTVRVVHIRTDSFDRTHIQVETPTQQGEVIIPLPGLYNVYNALAAITAAQALDISWDPIVMGIEQFKPVFGRGERVQIAGRNVRLLLAKNPTGFNEVLRTLFTEEVPRHVLFVLNDNTADGKDISWIWDVDFERAAGHIASLVIGGTRALDLGLRMKYAGIDQQDVTIVPPAPLRSLRKEAANDARARRKSSRKPQTELEQPVGQDEHAGAPGSGSPAYGIAAALDAALAQTPAGETLFIVPTYTGLLEIHREMERRGLAAHYWERA